MEHLGLIRGRCQLRLSVGQPVLQRLCPLPVLGLGVVKCRRQLALCVRQPLLQLCGALLLCCRLLTLRGCRGMWVSCPLLASASTAPMHDI